MAGGEANTGARGEAARCGRGEATRGGGLAHTVGRALGAVYGRGMLRAWVLLVVAGAVLACGESRQALYMQGMKVEGDAERGPCKLIHDKEVGAALLTGDQVQQCLQMQSEALALYDRAAGLGLKDADFVQAHEQARGRVARLEGMLKMVREMERPAGIQGLGEATPEAPAVPAVQ